ncbi:MAG: radical SAM protein [Candidatus Hodarchaeota archaeon]
MRRKTLGELWNFWDKAGAGTTELVGMKREELNRRVPRGERVVICVGCSRLGDYMHISATPYQMKKIPHLRVVLTPLCNFKCIFCKSGGESGYISQTRMKPNEIQKIIQIAADAGLEVLRFTGGEPTLSKNLIPAMKTAKELGIPKIQLVTNGSRLEKTVPALARLDLDNLTVSLESLDHNLYHKIIGRNILQKIMRRNVLERVKKGIKKVHQQGISLRFNMILMQLNIPQFNNFIEYAGKYEAEVKILDLLENQVPNQELWERIYLPTNWLKETQKNPEKRYWITPPGGYGVPMEVLHLPNGARLIFKDSLNGTHYSSPCKKCLYYPCQDGMYGLWVTHDGKTKICWTNTCWTNNETVQDMLTPIRQNNYAQAKEVFHNTLKIYKEAKFAQVWQPNLDLKPLREKYEQTLTHLKETAYSF